MSTKVGHADVGDNQLPAGNGIATQGPSEQVIERDTDGKIKDKKKFKVSKKQMLRLSMKVGKTTLKAVDTVADSGVVEQANCLGGLVNAIPCGPLFCCFCRVACIAWKGRDEFKRQCPEGPCTGCPWAGMGPCPGGDLVEDIVEAAVDDGPDASDVATDVALEAAEKIVEDDAKSSKSSASSKSSVSTFSMPEWCGKAYECCHRLFVQGDEK